MQDPQQALSARFSSAIASAFGDAHAETDPLVRPSANPAFGDYQANVAMGLAKQLKRKPRDVAAAILAELAACHAAHPDNHVRLLGFDNYAQSAGTAMVIYRGTSV